MNTLTAYQRVGVCEEVAKVEQGVYTRGCGQGVGRISGNCNSNRVLEEWIKNDTLTKHRRGLHHTVLLNQRHEVYTWNRERGKSGGKGPTRGGVEETVDVCRLGGKLTCWFGGRAVMSCVPRIKHNEACLRISCTLGYDPYLQQ